VESLDYQLFHKVNKLELWNNGELPITSSQYLSTLINFSQLVGVRLCISLNILTGVTSFLEKAHNVRSLEIDNSACDVSCNIRMGNVCLMIPRHVKQFDISVTTVDDMKMILERLDHLSNVVFRLSRNLPYGIGEIITWLKNKRRYVSYYYTDNYLSIWLGKKLLEPSLDTAASKRAKAYHRYVDF
jgi:hypothetical protein